MKKGWTAETAEVSPRLSSFHRALRGPVLFLNDFFSSLLALARSGSANSGPTEGNFDEADEADEADRAAR
jgi:hypothetical protein